MSADVVVQGDSGPRGQLVTWRLDKLEKERDELCDDVASIKERFIKLEQMVNAQAESYRKIEEKLDSANSWLRGVMGSLLLSLVLLVFTLLQSKAVTK